jgi:hypothetical protein
MPNEFFVKCTSAYDSERYLYRVLEMETYNQKGVQIVYYPVTLSATDALFVAFFIANIRAECSDA